MPKTIALILLAIAASGCALDYETKSGSRVRFSVTASELADALEGYRK